MRVILLFFFVLLFCFGESQSDTPTEEPTATPTFSSAPISKPTKSPHVVPTANPSMEPTPTSSPSIGPTMAPSISDVPTSMPSSSKVPRYFKCGFIEGEYSATPSECVYSSGNVFLEVRNVGIFREVLQHLNINLSTNS